MIWCIKAYIIAYVKIQKNKDILSIMSNLQPNVSLNIDFQKVDQHAGGRWLIHDTKRRKDSQLQILFWRKQFYPIRKSIILSLQNKAKNTCSDMHVYMPKLHCTLLRLISGQITHIVLYHVLPDTRQSLGLSRCCITLGKQLSRVKNLNKNTICHRL